MKKPVIIYAVGIYAKIHRECDYHYHVKYEKIYAKVIASMQNLEANDINTVVTNQIKMDI